MNSTGLVRYRHDGSGFSMPAPGHWLLRENPQDKVATVLIEPRKDGDPSFRPTVLVSVDRLKPGLSLVKWQRDVDAATPKMLDEYMPLNIEVLEIDGHEVYHRLGQYRGPDHLALTLRQWATVRGRNGYMLTATAATVDAPRTANLFTTIARGFHIDPAPAKRSDARWADWA